MEGHGVSNVHDTVRRLVMLQEILHSIDQNSFSGLSC